MKLIKRDKKREYSILPKIISEKDKNYYVHEGIYN